MQNVPHGTAHNNNYYFGIEIDAVQRKSGKVSERKNREECPKAMKNQTGPKINLWFKADTVVISIAAYSPL